jgi:hypothetical protein
MHVRFHAVPPHEPSALRETAIRHDRKAKQGMGPASPCAAYCIRIDAWNIIDAKPARHRSLC